MSDKVDFKSILDTVNTIISDSVSVEKFSNTVNRSVQWYYGDLQGGSEGDLLFEVIVLLIAFVSAVYFLNRVLQIAYYVSEVAFMAISMPCQIILRSISSEGSIKSGVIELACFVSGSSEGDLNRCVSCRSARVTMAISVIFAAVFAGLSFSIAVSFAQISFLFCALLGIIYGVCIFLFDTNMILQRGYFIRGDLISNFSLIFIFTLRLAFVFVVALAAAAPVEIKIFNSEINALIEKWREEKSISNIEDYNERRQQENTEEWRLMQNLKAANARIDELNALIKASEEQQKRTDVNKPQSCVAAERAERDARIQETCISPEDGSPIPACKRGLKELHKRAKDREVDLSALCILDEAAAVKRLNEFQDRARSHREEYIKEKEAKKEEIDKLEQEIESDIGRFLPETLEDRPAGLIDQIRALNALHSPKYEVNSHPSFKIPSTVPPLNVPIAFVMFIILMAIELVPFMLKLMRAIKPGCWERGDAIPCGK
ncbi:MAG: DUF4407 domain-containing protein [Neomegalonema sp.]|nr:DUF4407 domain-containing protein [Neomegalonema sp.]